MQPRYVESVRLELKYIPDAASCRTDGPYLYQRWSEGKVRRSRYLGKPQREHRCGRVRGRMTVRQAVRLRTRADAQTLTNTIRALL